MTTPVDPTTKKPVPKQNQVLRVHRYDSRSQTSKQKQIIQLNADQTLKGKTLKDIRDLLVKNNVFDSKDFKSPFCEKDGSDVGDDMKGELYFALLGVNSLDASKVDIYFKTKKLFTKIDEATQAFINQKLDLAFENEPEMIKKNPELLTSGLDPGVWKAAQGALSHAADLTEKEWSVITRANCLLSGHHVIHGMDGNPRKVERSAYNAFTLRPREFDAYEISSKGKELGQEKYKCHIPHYRVDDISSVTVVELKNAFEKSLADSSFTEGSFQVAGAVGLGPVSGGLKAGGGGGKSHSKGKGERTKDEMLMVNYNYPRVTIHWDPVCLDVTDECVEDIKKVKTPTTLQEFHDKYGEMFALRIQLGGRLSCTKVKSAESEAESKDEASKFKAEASASISSAFFQASTEFKHENQQKKTTENSNQKLSSTMAWEATGGDTLMCNNPPRWCASVGQYKYWRVTNQEDAVPLYHFLARFPRVWNEIIERFDKSAQDTFDSTTERQNNQRTEEKNKDFEGSLDKKGRQVFQLIEESTGRYLSVAEGTQDVVRVLQGKNTFDIRMYKDLEKIWQDVSKAQACIKLHSEVSDRTTEFMGSKRFGEGDRPAIQFWEPFRIQSCGHQFRQWLNVDPIPEWWMGNTNYSMNLKRLVHLSDAPGAYCCFWDVNNFENKGFIQDGAAVYVGVGVQDHVDPTSIYWRSIKCKTSWDLLQIGKWRADSPVPSEEPLKFTFRAKEIVEVK